MRATHRQIVLVLALVMPSLAAEQVSPGEQTTYVKPDVPGANTDWFRDARTGVFIHLLPCDAASLTLVEQFDTEAIDVPFARKWAEVIGEWSTRYGDKVAGWWFDGGDEWIGFNNRIARIYADAVKRGNPKAIVTFNPGVRLIRWTAAEDYTAGELNGPFKTIPTSRWVEGSPWHALTYLESRGSARDTRYPADDWARWIGAVTTKGGVVSLDMGPNWDPQAGPIGSLAAVQCAGIYLNAGTGSPDKAKAAQLEYNVSLAPQSYAALFDLPCPIFWMPCFEEMRSGKNVMEYGTYYQFRQGQILPHLSDGLQNMFLSMLSRRQDPAWLTTLRGPNDEDLLATFGAQDRHMWCTGGFLYATGLTVTQLGDMIPRDRGGDTAVLSFDPIRVSCSDGGVTAWSHDPGSTQRYIFHVRDIGHYQTAMTRAMKTLLQGLP